MECLLPSFIAMTRCKALLPGTLWSWSRRIIPPASVCSLSPLMSSGRGHSGYIATFVPTEGPLPPANASIMGKLVDVGIRTMPNEEGGFPVFAADILIACQTLCRL